MAAMAMPWKWGGDPRRTEGGWEVPEGEEGARGGRRGHRHCGPRPFWMAMGGGPRGGGFHPPRPPGGPWGGQPPFGPGGSPFEFFFGGGRGPRRGRGPRARRGDVRTGILLLLSEEPRSGYEIIREGRERSRGAWRPSPGSVYPMLQQLEDEGLVRPAESAGGGRRRPFELSDEGRRYVEDNAGELTPPWEAVAEEFEDTHADFAEISGLAAQLSAAAVQVAQAGTPEQSARAKRLLADTRRGLYRILAEDDAADAGDGDDEDADG
ncbi:DNA-binding PadR family transcriptional regulator [Spinactinospora alkalitolerans]|uniref:DNA-binding PadR family transcriptional regulator n=1 Tax=Spinactinospora alkalitolerans TaxID=687207 RepID=A0A852TXT3_9ACTN|nr:PadR family transcriptional regulator [Spinactinospora alkalitolerans]NYE48571.1 DNA-binding PadR family transcriptional regulator [Spinactinospora alkalitolerans]